MAIKPLSSPIPTSRQGISSVGMLHTSTSSRHLYELQVKTTNYEAMMKRFQLRKVPKSQGPRISTPRARRLVIDKAIGSAKRQNRPPPARFSLRRTMRSITRWKTWRWVLQSLASPILPSSWVATLQGIVMLCTYHFQLFYLPFAPSYYPDGSTGTTAINITLELVFLLNLLLNFNTAFMRQNGLVTSRMLIARNYLNRWFLLDLLSAIPLNGLQYLVTTGATRIISQQETALMTLRLLKITFIERGVLLSRVMRIGKHLIVWFRYSRYSHLLGIAQLLWLVLLIAHYMACLWHVISNQHVTEGKSVAERYVADYYYAVSLIHGQGSPIGLWDEDFFSTVAILVGSVVLAIVFGNVAMLVSNFNANTTNYHRKMEAVFGTMNKMNLPEKLRERIIEYYTHVWDEYESLDGDVVKFQRELTHSLSLEVGLYKYMNLVTEIPFWKDCSPDFATQIILNLTVRIYLPDDYVVRKGETGDAMSMVNRGICALSYVQDSESTSDVNNGEGVAKFGLGDGVGGTEFDSSLGFGSVSLGSKVSFRVESSVSSMDTEHSSQVRPQQYQPSGGDFKASMTARSSDPSERNETQFLFPGQTCGEMSLLMNHDQPMSIRAVTYVEMCILDRATFQRLLSRYPKDRRTVLMHLLHDCIDKGVFPFAWEEVCDVVLSQRQRTGDPTATLADVDATITSTEAAEALVERLDVDFPDETIKCGFQGSSKPLDLQLPPVARTTTVEPAPSVCACQCQTMHRPSPSILVTGGKSEPVEDKDAVGASATASTRVSVNSDVGRDEMMEMMRAMTDSMHRMEGELKSVKDRLEQIHSVSSPKRFLAYRHSSLGAITETSVASAIAATTVARADTVTAELPPRPKQLLRVNSENARRIGTTMSPEGKSHVPNHQQEVQPSYRLTRSSSTPLADYHGDSKQNEVVAPQNRYEAFSERDRTGQRTLFQTPAVSPLADRSLVPKKWNFFSHSWRDVGPLDPNVLTPDSTSVESGRAPTGATEVTLADQLWNRKSRGDVSDGMRSDSSLEVSGVVAKRVGRSVRGLLRRQTMHQIGRPRTFKDRRRPLTRIPSRRWSQSDKARFDATHTD
ncbi:hypothetical protein BBJ28_00015409 [Nothophytophthora sp. Chile5]|nr:hypothetical protein BBJ28_00015409 [Nothophytophthora sp. Chile5]